MLLAVIFVLIGLGLALARGGSVERLVTTEFRWVPLLITGLVVQLAFTNWLDIDLSQGRSLLILLLSNVMIAGFILYNRKLPGMILAGIGIVLNVIVITANGAMPVSQRAAEMAGIDGSVTDIGLKHERLTDDTIVPFLGDVIPVPLVKEIVSIGDLLLAGGLAYLTYTQSTRVDQASKQSRRIGKVPS